MSCGNLNIVNENTTVVTVPENNTITITDLNSCNVVTAIQQITETVQIGVPGPRGVQGPPGPNSLPGGLDTQIQFNSASQFSGSSNFTFDYTTNILVLTGSMDITGSLTVNTVNVGQNTLNFIDNTGAILNSISVDNSANVILASGSFEANSFSGSFTGSLQGTSSLATSASYALSASYLVGGVDFSTLVTTASFNTFTSSYNTGSFTGSFKGDGSGLTSISASAVVGLNLSQIISGSYSASIANDQLLVNTGVNAPSFTGSLYGTSSWAINFVSASDYLLILATASMLQPYVLTSATSSMLGPYVLTSQTSSFVLNSQTSSMLSPYALTTQLNSYLTTGSANTTQTISGSLTINQNLTVLGSQSVQYVTSSQLDISTNIITVNVANPAVRFGGIAVIDSGSSPQGSGSFLYDSVQDEFIFVHKGNGTNVTSSHFLVGPETYDSLGNEIYIPANTILKAVGNEHVTGSNITDTGNVVSINSDTQITGSLTVSSNIFGTASWAQSASNAVNAQTASFAPNYLLSSATSSMLDPYVLTSVTSSMLESYVLTNVTSSMLQPYVLTSQTSSMSVATASYALNAASLENLSIAYAIALG